jgi:hypothetical protein
MIRRGKPCHAEGCKWGKFGGDYCYYHQSLRTDAKYLRQQAAIKAKKLAYKPTPIPKRSSKRLKEEEQYSKDRKEFLERPENMFCAVFPWKRATQVHHKMGRIGPLLLDQRFWIAVSDEGHKKIEAYPVWAKENNFSLDRLSNNNG